MSDFDSTQAPEVRNVRFVGIPIGSICGAPGIFNVTPLITHPQTGKFIAANRPCDPFYCVCPMSDQGAESPEVGSYTESNNLRTEWPSMTSMRS